MTENLISFTSNIGTLDALGGFTSPLIPYNEGLLLLLNLKRQHFCEFKHETFYNVKVCGKTSSRKAHKAQEEKLYTFA